MTLKTIGHDFFDTSFVTLIRAVLYQNDFKLFIGQRLILKRKKAFLNRLDAAKARRDNNGYE